MDAEMETKQFIGILKMCGVDVGNKDWLRGFVAGVQMAQKMPKEALDKLEVPSLPPGDESAT